MSESRPNPWFTPGVRGIGLASLLADLGHEIPTALLPSFLTATLGAPAAALGLIEGLADALSGITKFAGGPIADDPGRRRNVAVGGYTVTAVLSALIGLATSAWQVGLLRAGSWAARGLRVPSRNALLADAVDPAVFGRAYGFERTMDNLGAVGGPILALALVALVGVREAIVLSVIPGLLAAAAIVYAVRHLGRVTQRRTAPIRIVVRPLLHGMLGRLFVAVLLFEAGNMAATLLILRATESLAPDLGADQAAVIGVALYVGYNLIAAVSSFPAGRLVDARGPRVALAIGVVAFGLAYALFAASPAGVTQLALGFGLAGVGIGIVEVTEHAAVATYAPVELRGSSFGLLAGIQSVGDLVASAVVGLLWTLVSPTVAFGYGLLAMIAAGFALGLMGWRAGPLRQLKHR